ncbi:MAPEG family protein [Roseiarcaceae bacterium H3SJ34-1]|uniref:MAPEG family protein n=1 Tax=Terripilifer ovatus TaxID=3032367 RepID=UPI003AB972C6|nr:MAPEG family protein [Roseiarcaceae bacterium H3SJ34-1]
MGLTITGLYAGLLAIIMVVLLGNVGRLRSKKGVSLGDNGDRDLLIANRQHMNFVECVPLALLLLAVVEANGAPRGWVHALGIILLISRLIHPFGINPASMNTTCRIVGSGGTILMIVAAALTALWQFFR